MTKTDDAVEIDLTPELAIIWKKRLEADQKLLLARDEYLYACKSAISCNIAQGKIIETMVGLLSHRCEREMGQMHDTIPQDPRLDEDTDHLERILRQMERNKNDLKACEGELEILEAGGPMILITPRGMVKLEEGDAGVQEFERWCNEEIVKIENATERHRKITEEIKAQQAKEEKKLEDLEIRQQEDYQSSFLWAAGWG